VLIPFDNALQFEVSSSKPAEFAGHLRIPAWTEGATVAVNGKPLTEGSAPQTFATIRRQWNSGERIELDCWREPDSGLCFISTFTSVFV